MPDATATVAAQPPDPTQPDPALPAPPPPTDAHPSKRKRRRPSAEEVSDRNIKKWSEIFETAILTLATLATVWAGYQSGQWSGIQSSSNVQSITQRIEASELMNSAQQLQLVDVALFSNWVNAIGRQGPAPRRLLCRTLPGRVQAGVRCLGRDQAAGKSRCACQPV